MKKLSALLFCLLIPGPAAALYWDAGTSASFGANGYGAVSAFAEAGADEGLYARPSVTFYHSDFVKSTKVYTGRVGWAGKRLGVGVEGSFTPKADGYQNTAFAADVAYAVVGEPRKPVKGDDKARLARLVFGAGVRHIAHKESLAELQQRTPTADRALDAGQTDLTGFAGASLFGFNLDASITQSVYTQNLPRLIRPVQPAAAAGANPTAFGFPDTSADARLTFRLIPIVKPYATFAWRALKADQPAARTYTAGASASISIVEVSAFYSLYDPGRGAPKHGYSGASAGIRF
ncbi:MAG: hypothetical protein HY926_13235 [Elusimicrobia bacterium]|nr:hypothetical protein [Elusimicrobiota bacterium]